MRITKKFYMGVASLLIAAAAFVTVLNTTGSAVTMGDRRDCGYTDVILNCGATSQTELLQKYDSNNDGRGNRDIQAIYNYFGIQRSDIAGTTSEVKRGWLNTNGVITVDGKTVATQADSLYRVDPGDHEVSPIRIAGKTYYIGPIANNYSRGADLFVFFKDGVFHAAIQASCGNPIPAKPVKPQPKPEYACKSLTATKIDRTRFRFTSSATAINGAEIVSYNYDFGDGNKTTNGATVEHTYAQAGTYNVTMTVNVRVNGQIKVVPGTNCNTTVTVDEKPQEPVYKCDSLAAQKLERNKFRFTASASAANGATISTYTYVFGDGSSSVTTPNNTVEHVYAKPGVYIANLTVNFKVNGEDKSRTGTNCKVSITVEEKPQEPVYKCESLTATKINRTTYRFATSTVARGGAEVVNYIYDFGDGSRSTTTDSAVTHEYEKAGTYTTKVSVNFRVNGQIVTINDSKCKTTITVDEKPVKPVHKCENLTAQLIENKERTYEYVLTYEAEGGATLDRVVYNFGDGVSETFLPADAATVEHTFAQPGKFTTTAKLYFNVPNGEQTVEKSDECEVNITIEKPEYCEVPGKEHLPKDSPECKEDEMCDVPGKEHLPVDSPECYPPCEVPGKEHLPKDSPECIPPELPQTGLDLMIGGGIGLGSLSAAGYYYASSRRNLLSALNNK